MKQLIAIILFTFPLFIKAQTTKLPVFNGQIIAGFNASQVDGDQLAGYDKVGLRVGPAVSARIKDKFGLTMEILYSQKGSKTKRADQTLDYNGRIYKLALNYAEIPILFNYTDKGRLRVSLGGSYSRLITAKETIYYPLLSVNVENQDVTDLYLPADFCWIADVNYLLSHHLGVGLRSDYSLLPIRNNGGLTALNPTSNPFYRSRQYNNYIGVYFDYQFNDTWSK